MLSARKYYQYAIWLILSVLVHTSLHAQTVGVVLGGGGAKGFSHIGVLKALEENNIPIHFITGTSIGAIVGALYASGYSPAEIEALALSGKFEEWATGVIPEHYYSYHLKEDPTPALASFRFDYDTTWSMNLPTSLRSPVFLDFVMQQFFTRANVASGNQFDSLMIPFRCVAADITNNRPIVLNQGDLGMAVRASMTFPFVFKPIRIDGKLLYDGGMYNNFPADVMYTEFFPDIIIGSKAADNFDPPTDDNIISHLQTMLMENANFDVICDNSILIQPNLQPFHVLRFNNPGPTIDSGYYATLRKLHEIRIFVTDSVTPDMMTARRDSFLAQAPPLLIDRVYITGLNHRQFKFTNNYLSGKLFSFRPNYKPVPVEEIKEVYLKLATLDLFANSNPVIGLDSSSAYYYLLLDLVSQNSFSASFGGMISSSPVNEGFMELKYQFLRRQIHKATLNTYFGRFYNSLKIQDRIDFPAQQNIYLAASYTINHWNYFRSATAFIEDNTPSYLIERDRHIRVLMGKGIGNKGKAELDYIAGTMIVEYFHSSDYRSKDTLDRTAFRFTSPGVSLDFNNMNRTYFADAGRRFMISIRQIGGTEYHRPGSTSIMNENSEASQSWFSVSSSYEAYLPASDKWTIGFALATYFSNQKPFNNYSASVLFAPLWAPVPEATSLFVPQIRAFRYFALGGRAIRHITPRSDLRAEIHLFNPYNELRMVENQKAKVVENYDNVYGIAALMYIYHTPLGPISLNINYFHRAAVPVHLSVNFGYMLSNRKAWF